MPGIYISAAHKSSGKTTVMLGLVRALHDKGLAVSPFKKGPDYIDPAWAARAAGRSCYNLDFYTSTEAEIRALFSSSSRAADIAVIEGNKGLYDGMDVNGSDSNAALAKLLDVPVVLVIDTIGMTRGIAPLLIGYQHFDTEVRIGGIILNRVGGPRHEAKLIESIEQYTDIPVLGAIPRFRGNMIEERHLGLVPAQEDRAADETIARLANTVRDHVDLDRVIALAQTAGSPNSLETVTAPEVLALDRPLRIGIARDEAFGFYYADDLERFLAHGVELVWLDMIRDPALPDLDGLFIGGGFPETAMKALSENVSMRDSVRRAIENGLPTYAECGGLMYLSRSISWNGATAEMVGVIPGHVTMSQRPHGRGYIQLRETSASPWPGREEGRAIAGHEFHYSELQNLPPDVTFAYEVLRGTGIANGHDGFVYKNLLASYAHLRDAEQNHWVDRFLTFVAQAGRFE